MKVDAIEVCNLIGSIVASGFPMLSKYSLEEYEESCKELSSYNYEDEAFLENPHVQRAFRLSQKSNPGSGHDNFLSGIHVFCNITGTVKWWAQFDRYHFKQIISSQSTMHRLKNMIVDEEAFRHFNECVSEDILDYYLMYAKEHLEDTEWLAYNCPMGIELCARVDLNYLQLKTIWNQRCAHKHKLSEWAVFGEFIQGLPFSNELIINQK